MGCFPPAGRVTWSGCWVSAPVLRPARRLAGKGGMAMGESVRLRGMRHARSAGDVWRARRPRGMRDIWGTEDGILRAAPDPGLVLALQRERRRFEEQDRAVERMRSKLLLLRAKLKGAKERNAALCRYRVELQRRRWARENGSGSAAAGEPAAVPRMSVVTVEY